MYHQAANNPFLSYSSADSDAFLAYDHSQASLSDQIHNELFLCNQEIPEDLVQTLLAQLDSNGYFKKDRYSDTYSQTQIEQAVHILQRLEPYGCFSRSVKECLAVQCEISENPASETGAIICDYLEELANHHIQTIMKETNLSSEEIEEGLHFIQTLNPKPAANYTVQANLLVPEIKVSYHDKFEFESINQDYSLQFEDLKHPTEELKQLRQEAKQVLSALQKRNITLIQIMDTLCQIQKDFFLKDGKINYCTLEMVAKQCGLHVSTISRAINQKSFKYNDKYYPIKQLFSHSGLKEISAYTIKEKMKEIIESEDKAHPYSDEAIRKILAKENIHISRRTVTKYREQLFYFSAQKRKSEE